MALYAFDGTLDDGSEYGTDVGAIGKETNVYKFREAYNADTAAAGVNNVYKSGVGTRFDAIGALVGGMWGVGWLARINEAYDRLCENYAAGDTTIDVVGFSRGSALALGFVNKVYDEGVRRNDTQVVAHPTIRFLGLFDVVAAFALANLGGPFAKFEPFHPLTLPANVQHAFHAMALDERRPSFEVTRVHGAYEVWFRGVHSDIGGGNQNLGLSDISLRWMWRKAITCGLPITELNLNLGRDDCRPTDPIRPNLFSKISSYWRTIGPADLLHYTVAQHMVLAGEPCNDLPATCPVETAGFEDARIAPPAVQP